MSRARLTLIALGMAFALPTLAAATESLKATDTKRNGTWRSAPDEMPLSTSFDESVWGKNAKSIRTVEMVVRATGDASLTVTRKVLDGRGRTVAASTSIEHADVVIGPPESSNDVRSELSVTVKSAERRYPDDPTASWALDGLKVGVATFPGEPESIEVRVDFPEGRGSFWETLKRAGQGTPRR